MTTLKLTRLPNEILDSIALSLDRYDFAALSLSCKTLNIFAVPHLYHDITCDYDKCQTFPLQFLLRSILANRKHARYVKHLDFSGSGNGGSNLDPHNWGFHQEKSLKDPTTLRLAQGIIRRQHLSDPDGVLPEQIKSAYPAAIVALLVSQLRNLQTLSIGHALLHRQAPGSVIGAVIYRLAVTQSASLQPCFSALQHARIGVDMPSDDLFIYGTHLGRVYYGLTGEFISAMLHQPLKSLEIVLPYDEDLAFPAFNPPPTFELTSLTLRYSEAPTAILTKLLALTPNLQQFRYEACHDVFDKNMSRRYEAMHLGHLLEALRHVRRSLKLLELKIAFFTTDEHGVEIPAINFGLVTHLGSLNDFKELTHVELPIVAAWSWTRGPGAQASTLRDLLPHNIEYLCLRDDGYVWWKSLIVTSEESATLRLRDDLRGCKAWLPRVKRLDLKFNSFKEGFDYQALDDSFNEIATALASEGINLCRLRRGIDCDKDEAL